MELKLKVFLAWAMTIGAVSFAEDAYVASNGSQGVNTGYCMTPDTRWEVDFQLTATTPLQARVVGGDNASPNFFDAGVFRQRPGRRWHSGRGGCGEPVARHDDLHPLRSPKGDAHRRIRIVVGGSVIDIIHHKGEG